MPKARRSMTYRLLGEQLSPEDCKVLARTRSARVFETSGFAARAWSETRRQ
jgi:hypothetical protein